MQLPNVLKISRLSGNGDSRKEENRKQKEEESSSARAGEDRWLSKALSRDRLEHSDGVDPAPGVGDEAFLVRNWWNNRLSPPVLSH